MRRISCSKRRAERSICADAAAIRSAVADADAVPVSGTIASVDRHRITDPADPCVRR